MNLQSTVKLDINSGWIMLKADHSFVLPIIAKGMYLPDWEGRNG